MSCYEDQFHISVDNGHELGPMQVAAFMLTDYESGGQLKVLVAERRDGPDRGHLTFPGGRLLPAESSFHAACRELAEETGITLTPSDRDRLISFPLYQGSITSYTSDGEVICLHVFSYPLRRLPRADPRQRIQSHGPWCLLTLDEIISSGKAGRPLVDVLHRFFTSPSYLLHDCLLVRLGYDPEDRGNTD